MGTGWQSRKPPVPQYPSEAVLVLALLLTRCVIVGEMLPSLGPSSLSIGWILNLGSLPPLFTGKTMWCIKSLALRNRSIGALV